MVTTLRKPPHPPKPAPANTDTWLTRAEACDVLGVAEKTIATWQERGILNALRAYRKLNNGQTHEVWVYDPRELAKAPVRRVNGRSPGDVAARAFEMFDNGAMQREVVVGTHEEPDKVEELYAKWLDMGGANVVITYEAKSELQKLVGPFDSVAGLIAAIRVLARESQS